MMLSNRVEQDNMVAESQKKIQMGSGAAAAATNKDFDNLIKTQQSKYQIAKSQMGY
jgi:hypothetical protein